MARTRRTGAHQRKPADVFLNIPYDAGFQRLYIAYIAGISAFGLVPRATLEIPGGARRLDRILKLIRNCRYSVHDLSRVELDRIKPRTPRFNMPFELGLCVAWTALHSRRHTWFVFEAVHHRLGKSLSDLNGSDPYVHEGKITGLFGELRNAFVRSGGQPSVPEMATIYRIVQKEIPGILGASGGKSVFKASVFRRICVIASAAADALRM